MLLVVPVPTAKLTGASSSGGRIGELDCMKGATSIIDFVSMPEAVFDVVITPKVSPIHTVIPRNPHLRIEQTCHFRLQYSYF
jgi:hypothetical protein